jgi:antitoxin HicB
MQYAIKLEDIGGEFMATCRDVPEFHTVADDVDGALLASVEAMQVILSGYVDDRRAIPAPSKAKRGEHLVALPVLTVAKIGLFSAMLDQGVSKAKLARLLGVHSPQVDRLLDLTHGSKIEAIEHALWLLGKRMVLDVQQAA